MTARIDTLFMTVALCYFVVGISLGIGMGIAQDFRLMHLHAHLNLLGFVGHGIFGLTYRQWPGLRDSALAAPQLWIMLLATPVFLAGLPLAQYYGQPIFAIIGSLLVLVSAVLFLVMFAGKAMREARA